MWLKKLFFPFVLLFLLLFGITTSTLVFAQKDTSSHVKPKVALVIDDFGQYNTEAVSYTHLDVYKRQIFHRCLCIGKAG